MKNSIQLLLCFVFISGFSQNSTFNYSGRYTPTIKKEKLKEAKFVNEIMPEFERHFSLPNKESFLLSQQLKLVNSPKGYYIYPQESFYPQDNYEKIIDFISIEISAISNGKTLIAKNDRAALTTEQKNILNAADLGSDVQIRIKFKYKYNLYDNGKIGADGKEGNYIVTVVPETEAQYPGGFKQMTEYFRQNITNKISEPNKLNKLQMAIVYFTVNEDGQVVNAKITNTSSDSKIDKLILDAMNKMPKWSAAKNAQGIKVKQEFTIPFGGGGC